MHAKEPTPPIARPPRQQPFLLQAERISFGYGGNAPVFSDLSLGVRPGEIVALLGGSGCGKSTLLRVLSGLAPVQSGRLEFDGSLLTRPHPRAALVFQSASLLPWRNVWSNTAFGLDFKHQPKMDRETRRERIANALRAVGLEGREHSYPAQLSGGQAQRVALARALAREPMLLFADEPFAALDAMTRSQMQALLVDVVRRWHSAVLLVTHDIDEAIMVADRIVLMGPTDNGQAGLIHEWTVAMERPRTAQPQAAAALHFDIVRALGAPALF